MEKFDKLTMPETGEKISFSKKKPKTPDNPIIPFIRGDGIGPEIWAQTEKVLNAAVKKTYKGKRKIEWFEIFAGEMACKLYGKEQPLPDDALKAIRRFSVVMKGPLTTPVGGGFRSLNVAIRRSLDLYAGVRPIRYIPGTPSPEKNPEKVNLVIFRENTEDVYSGVEWPANSQTAQDIITLINQKLEAKGDSPISLQSALGIKPISRKASRRLVCMAIEHAIDNKLPSVTLVHKGNIMKYTEGAFVTWGYEAARELFGDGTVTWDQVNKEHRGETPPGKVLIKDRIADAMFQDIILRPAEHSVVATTNLNGDYLSDAAAALVGGLGLAPSANIGEKTAVFEATHGTANKYADRDIANPSSLIVAGCQMLRFIGWEKAGDLVFTSLTKAIAKGQMTADLARWSPDVKALSGSQFGSAIVNEILAD